jgi:hypothetical protein
VAASRRQLVPALAAPAIAASRCRARHTGLAAPDIPAKRCSSKRGVSHARARAQQINPFSLAAGKEIAAII